MRVLTVKTIGEYMGGIYAPETIRTLLCTDPDRLPPTVALGGAKRKRRIWLSDVVDEWMLARLHEQNPDLVTLVTSAASHAQSISVNAPKAPLKRRPGRPRKLEAATA